MEHRNHYLAQAVNTASPAHLVTMLFDRLLVAIRRVEAELESESTPRLELCHNELVRAQRIVEELRFGLDHERGGEIASNLRRIYDHCHEVLLSANMTKSATGLHDIVDIVEDLREVWFEEVDKAAVLAN